MNIIKCCQTLSSFTDPNLWNEPEKRYMAYGVSSLRRLLIFGCFRNYELGMQAMKDIYLASLSLGSKVFEIILVDLHKLMENAQDLDLRWINTAVLEDAIQWCSGMS